MLRFIATIKLKEATASQLFKRLNSYSRQHPLYHALKEFGKIPKSDFLLRYTDIVELRQAIEKQLNKGKFRNQRKVDNSFLGQTLALRHRPLWRSLDPRLEFNRPSPPVRSFLTAM
jgi:TnpA family transposase